MNFTVTPADPSTKLTLFTKHKTSCSDWHFGGGRKNDKYDVIDSHQHQKQIECNLAHRTCIDVYHSGKTNGFYELYSDPNGPPESKECIFDKRDCQDWRNSGHTVTGVYEIFIPALGHKQVRCEMAFEGRGWTTMQRR